MMKLSACLAWSVLACVGCVASEARGPKGPTSAPVAPERGDVRVNAPSPQERTPPPEDDYDDGLELRMAQGRSARVIARR